ncbi:MAG TPA: LysR substrate-binding domain-containing protein, partial [Ramlibacter sp.]|nr:LysR substrate-binding domain-containing protein [Ramlibacter sp.]
SARLKRLEERLGLNLAVRSSHRLGLTAEGERFAAEAVLLLGRLEALPETVQAEGRALVGPLRVCAPFGFGRHHVAPLLGRFAAEHPRIAVTLDLQETPWPTRREADLVVHIGEARDSSWVGHPLAPNERWVCASPAWVKARRFAPAHPRELLGQACICLRENEEDVTLWHYRRRPRAGRSAGPRESLRIAPALTTNDGDVARHWAEQGLGIVLRSQWDAAPAVAAGRLVRLLPGWSFGDAPVLALAPARKGVPARVAELVKFLQAAYRPRPPWA